MEEYEAPATEYNAEDPALLFRIETKKEKYFRLFNKKEARLSSLFFVFIVLFVAIGIIDVAGTAEDSMAVISGQAPVIREAISKFDIGGITKSLELADKEIKNMESAVNNFGFAQASGLMGNFIPSLGELPGALKNISLLSENLVLLGQDMEFIKNNGLQMVFGKKGDDFINVLERVESGLDEVEKLNRGLKMQTPSLKNLSPKLASLYDVFNKNYIYINLNISKAKRSLGALLSILKPSENKHFLLIFQNPTEMRPAGGFIGSYGDLVLYRGSLEEFKIGDIYNADRQVDLKIIPPKELQGITKSWGARDANWFFDFPTSAQKVVSFMEASDLYKKDSVKFSGAVAINTDVLGTIIEITGPIEIPAYNLKLDKDNFLEEIQYEVEAGRDKKPGQNPKRVLSALLPIIMEKIGSFDDRQKNDLVEKFRNHFEKKDIMVYFKDWQLESLMEDLGVAGEVAQLPKNYNGDYLAVVNANVAGGKSDAFIGQKIILNSEISSDGKILNALEISRKHSGQKEKDWWYRADNKNYLKILAPFGAKLTSVTGGNGASLSINDYSKDFMSDADLDAIEKSTKLSEKFNMRIGSEFGKTSFGAWFNTPAGKISNIRIKYEQSAEVGDNVPYSFVFEKQSGAEGSFAYQVIAPEGYIWKESGSNIFKYGVSELRAREEIDLTMIKIN